METIMPTLYRKVNKLSPVNAAYIAGIIDGEGTVTLTVKQKGGTHHLAVTISNTDLPLLQYIKNLIGAGKLTTKKTYKTHHLPSYTYAIYSRQALDLLTQVTVYLRTYKHKRAELALENYCKVTPRNGKYSQSVLCERHVFVQQFMSIKQ